MRRSLAATAALALLLTALFGGVARADTSFGGNPQGTPAPVSCGQIVQGAPSCTFFWYGNATSAGDIVPFGPTGGTGNLTSVTLPALTKPGQMQVDVLTSTAYINSSGKAEAACCSVKEISPAFTVPANQVSTVPLNLAVSSTPNAYHPGETQKSDFVALSVLDGTSSVPVRETGAEHEFVRASFPAISATTETIREFPEGFGIEMMASFTYGPPAALPVAPLPTPAPVTTPAPPAPAPAPAGPPSPLTGLALAKHPLSADKADRVAVLGKATNPPTTGTTQTLVGVLPAAHHRGAHASAAPKPVVLGRGKTVVPTGKSAPITVTLTAAARRALKTGAKLKATEKVVATGPGGTKTSTLALVLGPHGK
jgi:hypothetical protein